MEHWYMVYQWTSETLLQVKENRKITVWLHVYEISRICKSRKKENWWLPGEAGMGTNCIMVLFCGSENVLELDRGFGCTTLGMY